MCVVPVAVLPLLLLPLLLLWQVPIGPIGAHLTLTDEKWNVSQAAFICRSAPGSSNKVLAKPATRVLVLLCELSFAASAPAGCG
jgi:hypothetical protein